METLLIILILVFVVTSFILVGRQNNNMLNRIITSILLIAYIASLFAMEFIAYKIGQIDALNNKFKYKIEVKHTFIDSELVGTDTIYVKIKE